MIAIDTGTGNKRRAIKNGRRLFQSPASMGYFTDRASFPLKKSVNESGGLSLYFNRPVTLTVDWGDGAVDVYAVNTPYGSGQYRWRVHDPITPDDTPAWGHPPHVYADGAVGHTINLIYPPDALDTFLMDDNLMPVQDFAFGFSRHANLVSFRMNEVYTTPGTGAIRNLDLKNTAVLTKFTDLGISNMFNTTSDYYGAVPEELITPSLRFLSCGDKGFVGKSFDENNLNKLPVAKDALTDLTIAYAIGDTNGVDGPLPSNFGQLHVLKNLTIAGATYTSIPAIINTLPQLSTLAITLAFNMASWGNLDALVNLKTLNILGAYGMPTTRPTYFANLTSLTSLLMQSCFPQSGAIGYRAGAIDTFIASLYNFVIAPGRVGWRGVTFDLTAGTSRTADIPSNTSKTILQDLEDSYGWTCKYRKT